MTSIPHLQTLLNPLEDLLPYIDIHDLAVHEHRIEEVTDSISIFAVVLENAQRNPLNRERKIVRSSVPFELIELIENSIRNLSRKSRMCHFPSSGE